MTGAFFINKNYIFLLFPDDIREPAPNCFNLKICYGLDSASAMMMHPNSNANELTQ